MITKKETKALDTLRVLVSKEAKSELRRLKQRVSSMTRQRDKWRGRANELKHVALRYQQELVATRAELKLLRKQG